MTKASRVNNKAQQGAGLVTPLIFLRLYKCRSVRTPDSVPSVYPVSLKSAQALGLLPFPFGAGAAVRDAGTVEDFVASGALVSGFVVGELASGATSIPIRRTL